MENTSRKCPSCGAALSDQSYQGLCPVCLLAEVARPTQAGLSEGAKGPEPSAAELAAAFPHLEILGMIGRGGMGYVFKARQAKLDRFVALKILPESLAADPAFAERFSQEGRVLARLNHPSIVTIHDFGQANGFFYLLMEFVDGVNLRQAMQAGRFTPEQALAVVPKICDALEFAHSEGILHRDIKPENILLDARGRVKIADFGIAKIIGTDGASGAGAAHLTGGAVTGIIGTPQYMAPEQMENPRQVDRRADIYALGVVFYEMLTGELPIGRFAPPSAKSGVDPRLDEVVLRTLEKEPQRRTSSAGEVKTQVETIANSGLPPLPAAPPKTLSFGEKQAVHLRRAGRAAVVSFVCCLGAAIFLALVLPTNYLASARVMLNVDSADPYTVQTEVERVLSREVLNGALESLHLPERWASRYGAEFSANHESVLAMLGGSLNVQQARNTSLLEISGYSDSPKEAAEIANAVAESYCVLSSNKHPRIVDRAAEPIRPIRPNRPLIIAIGALLGFAVSSFAGVMVGLISFWRAVTSPARQAARPLQSRQWRLPLGAALAVTVLIGGYAIRRATVKRTPFSFFPARTEVTRPAPLERADGLTGAAETTDGRTTTLLLNKAELSAAGDRLSVWTDSQFAPGEKVVPTLTRADGRTELAMAQTITMRNRAGTAITTVFSWAVSQDGFGVRDLAAAQEQVTARAVHVPLRLEEKRALDLFVVTNQSGAVTRGSLEFRPEDSPQGGQAVVSFSAATNVSHLLLAYFTSSAVPGCVLQAGAIGPDGVEADAHTSIARSATFDNENCRWDLPPELTKDEMRSAADQINQLPARQLAVPVGGRARAFAVTNQAGGVYEAFFELLSGAKARLGSEGKGPTKRTAEDREVAQLRLQYAQQEFQETEKKHEAGVVGRLTLEQARAERDRAQADAKGDAVEGARINVRIAQLEFEESENKWKAGAVDAKEYMRAKFARDVARLHLRQIEAAHEK